MRRQGILTFDALNQNWKIRVGEEQYDSIEGMYFDIRIKNNYYEVCFEKEYYEDFITIEDDVSFALRITEEYHIIISDRYLINVFEADLPF